MAERDLPKPNRQNSPNKKSYESEGSLSDEILLEILEKDFNSFFEDKESKYFFVDKLKRFFEIAKQDTETNLQKETLYTKREISKEKITAELFTLLLINELGLAEFFIPSEEEKTQDLIDMDYEVLNMYFGMHNSTNQLRGFLENCDYNIVKIIINLLQLKAKTKIK